MHTQTDALKRRSSAPDFAVTIFDHLIPSISLGRGVISHPNVAFCNIDQI